jgi:isocitrate lyase
MADPRSNGNTAPNPAEALQQRWATDPRYAGIQRTYSAEDVIKLQPTLQIEQTLARHGAERLWKQLNEKPFVRTFGAYTGNQAVQMVRGGLEAIYLSGWQVAADGNLGGQTYPDQSLYPANSVPAVVERINKAFVRADQISKIDGQSDIDWYAPIIADAEAGFGGPLHAFELTKSMIEAGAAGVHFEDQLAAEKKCGHMGGKVLVPTSQAVRTLNAARLAADVMDVPTFVFARTDALAATLLMNDVDEYDAPFITGERTAEGYYTVKCGMEQAISRGLAYAPYADMLWCETGTPDLDEAKEFADAIHAQFPGKMLAYNCSPSFNWRRHLDDKTIARFQEDIAALGYKFQFITLAGWHSLGYHTFSLAKDYAENGMSAYVELQEQEFASEGVGYTATKHQHEVGTGYFDEVLLTVTGGESSTTALSGSTEEEQFEDAAAAVPAG